jgi:uncharacterized repeat protein (TIGR01451 family)
MKKITLVTLSILSFVGTSFAAPSNADVQVALTAPATVSINTPTIYSLSVKNNGPVTAQNVQVTVDLPLTNTSPQVYILGDVSNLNTQYCSLVNKKIVCNFGSMKKNKIINVSYSYAAPVSTKLLTMTANVTTSSNDTTSGNNISSVTPNLIYPARVITSANVTNSHCTGTNLTSYFECALFPSAIATHATVFNSDNSITIGEPGYTGVWSQPTNGQLKFEYFDNGTKVLEFNGYAVNGSSCFDGLSNFFPVSTSSAYVSPYHVCLN